MLCDSAGIVNLQQERNTVLSATLLVVRDCRLVKVQVIPPCVPRSEVGDVTKQKMNLTAAVPYRGRCQWSQLLRGHIGGKSYALFPTHNSSSSIFPPKKPELVYKPPYFHRSFNTVSTPRYLFPLGELDMIWVGERVWACQAFAKKCHYSRFIWSPVQWETKVRNYKE